MSHSGTLLYLTISYFPDFLYIFQNIEIILRHLAAYDEQTVIIGAADDTSFQHIVIREGEIMNSDSDRGILALGENIVCRQESKAVGTDIIHGGRIFRIRILNLMVQALFRSIRGYLRRLLILGLVLMMI